MGVKWNKEIWNTKSNPIFLLSKASPLSTVDSTSFSKLAAQNSLSTHLPTFCSSANLLCFPDLAPSLEKHDKDSNFTRYANQNITNYDTGSVEPTRSRPTPAIGTCQWTRSADKSETPLVTRTNSTTTHRTETWWTRVSMATPLAPPAVSASSWSPTQSMQVGFSRES